MGKYSLQPLLFLIAIITFVILIYSNAKSFYDLHDSHIGRKVILDKDTLTVTTYSELYETYTLSNGAKIDFKLYENIKLKTPTKN